MPKQPAGEVPQFSVKSINIDRIVVVQSIYHQPSGREPMHTESKYARRLSSDEQPYQRCLKAGTEWQRLVPEHCWLDSCSLLEVANDEKPFAEQISAVQMSQKAQVLEVSFQKGEPEADMTVRAGESCRLEATVLSRLKVRSVGGTVRFTLMVYPA